MANLDSPDRLSVFDASWVTPSADPVLDALVRKASESTGAPIALVSLIMGRVQFFRSAVGLPPSAEIARASNRCDSFCQFVVMDERPFVVTDAASDPGVPRRLVDAFGVRAYAGVPLHVAGQLVGSLCVLDVTPRSFDERAIADLEGLSALAGARLEVLRSGGVAPPSSAVDPLSELTHLLRALERSLIEIGPLVRLAHGVAAGAISAAEAGLTAGLLDEMAVHHADLVDVSREALSLARAAGERPGPPHAPGGGR